MNDFFFLLNNFLKLKKKVKRCLFLIQLPLLWAQGLEVADGGCNVKDQGEDSDEDTDRTDKVVAVLLQDALSCKVLAQCLSWLCCAREV